MFNLCLKYFNEEANLSTSKTVSQNTKKKAIEDLKLKVKGIPIFDREKIAKEQYDKIKGKFTLNIKSKDFMEEYLEIVELVFLNDTDKNIIELYLGFIKINEESIKVNDLNTFEEEIKKYKLLFTVGEMNKIKKGIKIQSEKENFINFLKKLSKIQEKDFKDLYNQVEMDVKSIKYFNYPIEFPNQELFYYKFYVLLINQINEIYKDPKYTEEDKNDFIKNKKAVANLIIKNKVLENEKIINDEDKMNLLILFILYEKLDDNGESINFNRLLQTEEVNYEDLKKYIENKKIGEINEISNKEYKIFYLKFTDDDKIIEIKEGDDICQKNLNKEKLNYIDDIYKYYTIDSLLKTNEITPYINKLKEFLIKITNSKVYREAIIKLFPQYNKNLLEFSKKDIETCIKSRFKFYPYQDLGNCGATDKFSCYSYICVLFNIFSRNKKYYKVLRCGAVIDISLNELNHINQNILYYNENNKNLLNTPKGKDLKGENFEEILFGKKLESLRLLECFYILNENNWNQTLEDFKKNFKSLYDNSIEYSEKIKYLKNNDNNAVFNEFFEIIKNFNEKDFKLIELFQIKTKGQTSPIFEMSIYLPKQFCILGGF